VITAPPRPREMCCLELNLQAKTAKPFGLKSSPKEAALPQHGDFSPVQP